jgi:hypothetical protein
MNALARRHGGVALTNDGSAELDTWTAGLRDICRTATLDLSFRLGEFIIENVFSGDSSLWSEEGTRRASYRALASRADLPLSASALCRAVGVYVLVSELGGRERWRHLSASHFQEVLPIAPEKRTALLLDAERERWSVTRLRAEADRCKGTSNAPAQSGVARSIRRAFLGLSKQQDALSRIETETLRTDSRASLRDAIQAIHLALTELANLTAIEVQTARSKSDISELRTERHISSDDE